MLFDKKKFEVADNMPAHFAMMIPGMGVHHFSKEHLSDNDCKALISAGSKYVTAKKAKKEVPDYKEDPQ